MTPERRLFRYLMDLPSPEYRRWLALAEVPAESVPRVVRHVRDDPYPSYSSADEDRALSWIQERRPALLPTLLRVVDPPDDVVADLLSAADLPEMQGTEQTLFVVRFDLTASTGLRRERSRRRVPITDLAVASSLFSELFIRLSASHVPLGIELEPPFVMVRSGSVQFGTSGTLLAAGIGILLACSGGLVAAPIGYIGGSILTSAGAIDTILGWKKSIAEARKLAAERTKLEAEARKLDVDRVKALHEIRRLLSDAGGETHVTPELPASSCVSRSTVQAAASGQHASEAYANHVLNRTLPTLASAQQYTSDMTIRTATPRRSTGSPSNSRFRRPARPRAEPEH